MVKAGGFVGTRKTLEELVRQLQLQLNPAVSVDPEFMESIRVHCYRDVADPAVLDNLNNCFQQQRPIPQYTPESYTAFILSKPSFTDSVIEIHALECLGDDGHPNGELWVKLKSTAALAAAHDLPQEKTALPLAELQTTLLGAVELPNVTPAIQSSGPEWLCSTLVCGEDTWLLPAIETPLDVPERFAGHCYIKLVTENHPAGRTLRTVLDETSK
ncbi:hypothetical protein [Microbulbifer agarilyticus]|uniref:hypothetical protein n=1 Tax=Microbulbifer agarilyticus TaxID=260552 RepID=UPI001CD69469|nr:hypothetical protein [Microbulbifer agarilyticus]MCA0900888.1 hypothetical protein [Microbulbifer agarilyticus]